jgi:hydroxyacylglutathione hydrolase
MATLEIHQFPCLSDNYGYLVHDPKAAVTATIDTPDSGAILAQLERKGWTLTHILNTHHHPDHAGGNLALKKRTGCTVVGPRADRDRIPGIEVEVGEGDVYRFGSHDFHVHDTPGHTRGHIVYHVPDRHVAFVGDTLFAMGCGRLFEGTPAQMWSSLQKLMAWPDDTLVYCAHEYTQANARFALSVEPHNQDLVRRAAEVDALRSHQQPTVPTSMGLEKRTNPFLRPHSRDLMATIGMAGADPVQVFAETRRRKDRF